MQPPFFITKANKAHPNLINAQILHKKRHVPWQESLEDAPTWTTIVGNMAQCRKQ